MFKILIVEDDKNMRMLLDYTLKEQSYHVLLAKDGMEALDVLETEHIDLMVVDFMMPNMNGDELTVSLRESNYTMPIIMLTAKNQINDKRIGFKAGVDDYLTKPFEKEELLLRIEALLRRTESVNKKKLSIGAMTLDYESFIITYQSDSITLPQKEFLLLFKLLSNPNRIFTRIEIMDEIWGYETESTTKTVDVHVNNIRKKLEHIPEFSIVSVRGLGYKGVIHENK